MTQAEVTGSRQTTHLFLSSSTFNGPLEPNDPLCMSSGTFEGRTDEFKNTLHKLTERWQNWHHELQLMRLCTQYSFIPDHDVATMRYEGFLYILQQTAYITLGTQVVFARST